LKYAPKESKFMILENTHLVV